MMSYSGNDSTASPMLAGDLGIRLNFYMDVQGGGSSSEALIGLAIGAIEAGMCETVVVFRSMNGFSQVRIGGTGARASVPVGGDALHAAAYGWFSAGQNFSPTFMRHMYDYGTTPEQVAMVKVIHSEHASNNPKAYYKQRVTVEDVVNSRMICKPLHLLDCCVETDNATALIVTSVDKAYDYRNTPARILGVAGRVCKPRIDMHFQHGPISTVAGHYIKDIIYRNAGVGPRGHPVHRRLRRLHLHLDAPARGLRLLQEGRGRRLRLVGHHAPRRRAAQQHLRRPPLRGLHARE